MIKITELLYKSTLEYIDEYKKDKRKKKAQFFTSPSVANYMASLITIDKKSVSILDAGAGTGVLLGAACEYLLNNNSNLTQINVVVVENDTEIITILKNNLNIINRILNENDIKFSYKIIKENFIEFYNDYWVEDKIFEEDKLFDVIISNPPYKKIRINQNEAILMNSIIHGQPNLYALFMALSVKLLKKDGEFIYITPRSYLSGKYFVKFRKWLLNNINITHIHTFTSRKKVFEHEEVLQEIIITKAIKNGVKRTLEISQSEDSNMLNMKSHFLLYDTIIPNNEEKYILLPANNEELEIITFINGFKNNLKSLGFILKTGPVVDFRAKELIHDEYVEHSVPLIWPCNFLDNKIMFPVINQKPQYIIYDENRKKLFVDNKNYIIIKRFSSKEETRRIQPAVYLANQFNNKFVGFENHLNYLIKINGEMTDEELYGLYVIFNTTYYDKYYRILNGSTQVNAGEFNNLPLPPLELIIKMGKELMYKKRQDVKTCDKIYMEILSDEYKERCI